MDIQGGVQITYQMDFSAAEKVEKKTYSLEEKHAKQELLRQIMVNRASSSLGVVESSVATKGDDMVVVELPGYKNPEEARKTMSTTASIELYHAKSVATEKSTFRTYKIDERGTEGSGSPKVTFEVAATGKKLVPGDPEYKKMIEGWELILKGSDLKNATTEIINDTSATPRFFFQGEGAEKLDAWSRRFMNGGENLAFVLDGVVLSCNPKADGAILKNEAVLQGTYPTTYVASLTNLLNSGALPVSLTEVSNRTLAPSIGQEAMHKMLFAGYISFGFIVLFMLYYYGFPGFVAFLALLLYILFTLTAMKLTHTTLSLAALAGFILSIGMAVDANILVFERMKEEMREGRSMLSSVQLGFKRALTAIIDSNVCTIITSAFLGLFGTGLVKGFATSLIIGVGISLFTAITVTRSLLLFFVGSGIVKSEKLLLPKRNWFGEKFEEEAEVNPIKVVRRSKLYFLISLISIIPGLVMVGLGGIKPNVEFSGGADATYKANALSRDQISTNLAKNGYKDTNVKMLTSEGQNYVSITVPGVDPKDTDLYNKIGKAAGDLAPTEPPSFTTIGAVIQKEILLSAVKSVVLSSLFIVIYLSVRFGVALGGFKNGFKFGISAIAALVHDVLFVIGIAGIFGKIMGWEVSSLFVTAMLTVIGFSVHDTIVIFDRIRENLRKPQPDEDFMHLCDRSISQSLARSLNTAGTVVVTLAIMIAAGTPTIDLKFFCVTMLAGIVSGTYSSIFNATPILYLWDKMNERQGGAAATLVGQARAANARIRAAALSTSSTSTLASGGSGSNRGYGTIKRKSQVDQSEHEID